MKTIYSIGYSRSRAGFSLLELMVAIVIIGLLAGIAVPNIAAWLPRHRLKNAARDMVSFMREAKIEAIKTNTSAEIRFNSSVSPGYYYMDSGTDNNNWDPGEKGIRLINYKSGIDFGQGSAGTYWDGDPLGEPITFDTGSPDQVNFSTRGLSNTQGTVFLENKNDDICYAVTVLTTGSIKFREWTGQSWIE